MIPMRKPFAATLAFLIILPITARADNASVAKRYQASVEALEAPVQREVAAKELPSLAIALVDDQTVIWAKGFGHTDAQSRIAATADTVYRVGSVSKLFTDLAVMQLVERGDLDLDAPVTRYLPEFKPRNPFDRAI